MKEFRQLISSNIPENWEIRPLWSLFRRHKLTGYAQEELLSIYRDYGVIPKSSRDDNHNRESEDLSNYQLVTEGSLVTNKMKAWQGSIAISRLRGIVSPAYYVYQPLSNENDQYLHYLLRSDPYIALYGRISKGIRVNQWDLEHEALKTVPIILPPIEVQNSISSFLDYETNRINQLIEAKMRLVELVVSKQDTIRDEAVIKGLNPNSSFKNSNVKWFGTIPNHWSVIPFNQLVESKVGYPSPKKVVDGVVLVTTRNLRDGAIDYERSQEYVSKEDYEKFSARIKTEVGDVIFSREAPLGKVAQVDRTDVTFSQRIIKFRANSNYLTNEFLAEQMMSTSFQRSLHMFATGSTVLSIKGDHFSYLYGVVPPLEEQEQIVKFVRNKVANLSKLTKLIEISVKCLQEYRSALITAAVTGQIDVTTWNKKENSGK